MKILVIENPRPLAIEHYNDVANAPLSASLNSGYALAIARRAGWDPAYLDLTDCQDDEATISGRILAENADLILFHWVYAWGNENIVQNILKILKEGQSGLIGAFGLFPTLACQRLSEFAPGLDFILAGEFEATLDELLSKLSASNSFHSIAGLYCGNGEFVSRERMSDLLQLPIPDDVGANCQFPTMNIAASRGCFGDCSFCFINQYYGCRKRRERSINSFALELEFRLKRRAVNNVYFIDPTFIGYDEKQSGRAKEISCILKSHNLPFGFETRVDTINQDLIGTLAANGATSIFLGIESGCEAALQRINKRITREQIIRAVRAVQGSGITLSVGFIMFEPDSTLAELLENYTLLEELDLLSHHDQTINMLYHSQIILYGSRAWSEFAEQGRLNLDDRLPFEASYKFRHADVMRVCNAMRRLSTKYFTRMDQLYHNQKIASGSQFDCRHIQSPPGVKGDDLNRILKEAFLAFIKFVGNHDNRQFKLLESGFLNALDSCFNTD